MKNGEKIIAIEIKKFDVALTLSIGEKTFEEYQNGLFDDCAFMLNEVNSESSGSKFDKFDAEIEGYRKTIKEKEVLVFMGTDVLSNKRRIEIRG